ncbi:RNA polymerase sigma-70 factor [Chitinophaga sp. Cy-1792]|uniref:RNA polymerase sigma-70 factor n=1 Tax=Chitinophaga sp. Cy-1792 TaxID=2608339 RepID=UPI0014225D50|nr:RNA polymerase sigma-70 factor [Chitinophaga sp. Cy-1792]
MYQPNTGEAVSFEEQFRLHYRLLCTAAYYVVNDAEAARDIVQDFFLYCWKKRDTIQLTHDFRSYALKAIRNASLNYIKQSDKMTLEETHVMERLLHKFPSTDVEEEERRNAALWAAISKMPEQRRRIFLMSTQEGKKYKEVAAALDISINTVKTQIKLSLQFLRKECAWMAKLITILITLWI